MVNIFRNDGLQNIKRFVNLKYKKEWKSLYSYKILFDLRLQCAILTIGTGPYILFYTQSDDYLRLILRCWGNSSILCQQNSDAL